MISPPDCLSVKRASHRMVRPYAVPADSEEAVRGALLQLPLREDALIGRDVRAVAGAGGPLEACAVDHCHDAPGISDEAAPLQRASGLGDPDPAYPEHVGQELVRNPEGMRMRAVRR